MPTLSARIEYIASRAAWKILTVTWEDGQQAALPRQRYFDQQNQIADTLHALYLPESIVLMKRDPCREEHHSLQGAQYLASSRDGAQVYVRCGCTRFRGVSLEEWQAQRKAS